MPTFRYKGISASGEEVDGSLSAGHDRSALLQLDARKIEVLELEEIREIRRRLKSSNPKAADYYRMLRQLSVLISANIPVLESLDSLKSTVEHKRLVDELESSTAELRAGSTLSQALANSLTGLPQSVLNLVVLGERTGRLPEILRQVSEQMQLQEKMKRDLRSAFSYPMFLLFVGLATVVFLFSFVVPRFAAMIGDQTSDLPATARFVFSLSAFFSSNAITLLIGTCLLAVACVSIGSVPAVRKRFRALLFQSPIVGSLLRVFELSNWTRTMGIALSAKANILDSVSLASRSITSPQNRAAFDDVARQLRAGQTLDQSLSQVQKLEPVVLNLARTGVRSGQLGDMLLLATDVLDDDIRSRTERIGKLAEPIAVVAISALIGFVVISIVSAMTSLYDVAL